MAGLGQDNLLCRTLLEGYFLPCTFYSRVDGHLTGQRVSFHRKHYKYMRHTQII